ncbi:hypothetical protein CV_3510 [Chromobacterium violaceum ATCC 12472]|uniref:Uncharacterized protein n=1 Tax=Chromobacterium violaceum (strain ATCC 12472 / DSM 30191 / JCM 1249 / CCUG 213 / NBRC 12614 / NCIMB 9131 / NCTC 9757 / MK) TaxID=243365 RepID=Q7NSB6_CHRVO|nr:hypothetical protein CV_3510 [Chromobacterium violaceum ATCC 12472]
MAPRAETWPRRDFTLLPFCGAVLCHQGNARYNDENIRAEGWAAPVRRGDPGPRNFFEYSRKKRKGTATQ